MIYSSQNTQERGSVFVYILLAIALFAALTYAVTKDNQSNTNIFDEEKVKLAAQEIIEYGSTVTNAVQKLKLRGCTDTQISFENNVVSDYTNPNAPTDKSCHVFDESGGNIKYARLPDPYFDASKPSWRQSYAFSRSLEIEGIGSSCAADDCAELTMIVLGDEQLCVTMNSLLGISSVIPTKTDFDASPFIGTYISSTQIGEEASSAALKDQTSGCVHKDNGIGSYYWYYQVLLAR